MFFVKVGVNFFSGRYVFLLCSCSDENKMNFMLLKFLLNNSKCLIYIL